MQLRVASASVMDRPDHPASPEVVLTLADRGIDLSTHRSRTLDHGLVATADLVLTMERQHLRAAAVLAPGALARTFTLREFVRRGLSAGPRSPGQPIGAWLVALDDERAPAALLVDDPADEIVDPVGGTRADFERCADELDLLTRGVLLLLFGRSPA